MIRVIFTQAQIKQYRVPFFTKLHTALRQDGIEMKVAYSDPPEADIEKHDNVDLPAEVGIKVPGYWFLGNKFLYQALLKQALRADLVIAEQANKNLLNYIMLLCSILRLKRLAFFGHGRNRSRNRSWLSESIRPWVARRADWYFTYTEGTAVWLTGIGVAREKITVMQNSTDTRALSARIAAIPDELVEEANRRLGIEHGSRVGIYCSTLTPRKDIALLLEAARLVRERIPSFHLLILGGGPERERVLQAAAHAPWIHYLGPKFGVEKALFLKMSDCFLLPGCVGLAVPDSFAAGLPLFTTKVSSHGPEVEYLEEGVNGKMTENGVEAYAESISEVLSNRELLEHLKAGARESANRYSIEAMVERFRLGILQCLNLSGLVANAPSSNPINSGADGGLPVK